MVVKQDTGNEENQRFLQRWMTTISTQFSSFKLFLWNPEDRTVMGRGKKSWGQITIFYFFYYSFLAALFAISIAIVLGTLDPYRPRFQTRLQAPGLSIQPREPSDVALTSDIRYSLSNYKQYADLLNTFLSVYENQTDPNKFQDCPINQRIDHARTFQGSETVLACRFNRSDLGPCANGNYGYDEGKPCIFVRVNRIIGWFPVAFTNLDEAVGGSLSKAPSLKSVLAAESKRYNPYLIYVACYGITAQDQIYLNGVEGPSNNTKYYPDGIPFHYYPYYGNKRSPNYVTPVVAVQFNNLRFNVSINVGCKAYARNIQDDSRMQIGYYNFAIEIN